MTRIIVLLSVCLSATLGYAQKEYDVWFFGNRAGLDFNSKPVSAHLNNTLYCGESSTSICDKNGKMLFYTNGDTIKNSKHQVIKNGLPSLSTKFRTSARQGSMIVPHPIKKDLYYVFIGRSTENFAVDSFLRYWIVDMKGDGGLGEVVVKEVPLLKLINEGFSVTLHSNGIDFWVAGISVETKSFECVRTYNGDFTSASFSQNTYFNYYFNRFSTFKFSPDSKFFYANYYGYNRTSTFIHIFPYNATTGQISSPIKIPAFNYSAFDMVAEFSPDSRYLYVAVMDLGFSDTIKILQYDLRSPNTADVIASKTVIHKYTFPSYYVQNSEYIMGMQLASDGKIYVFNYMSPDISVIEQPNKKGINCNYKSKVVGLNGRSNLAGSPYYPNFWFKYETLKLGPDTIVCEFDTFNIQHKLSKYGKSFLWNTGDTTSFLKVVKSGLYILKVNLPGGVELCDSIEVKFKNKFKVFIGNDTAFCHQFNHLLNAGSGFKSYKWNTNDTVMAISVNSKGIYSVKVIDSNTCPLGDTITIKQIHDPMIKIVKDTVTCSRYFLSIKRQEDVNYLWNTNDTGIAIEASNVGRYTIKVYNAFCFNSDTVDILRMPKPRFNLGNDSLFCKPILLNPKVKGKYLWSNASKDTMLKITAPGIVWLEVADGPCKHIDSIRILPCDDLKVFVPLSFSPNGDGINDVFRVVGDQISAVKMFVYNRWGEAIIEGNEWDGNYKGEGCPQDIYFYNIKVTGYVNGHLTSKVIKGTITLLH